MYCYFNANILPYRHKQISNLFQDIFEPTLYGSVLSKLVISSTGPYLTCKYHIYMNYKCIALHKIKT